MSSLFLSITWIAASVVLWVAGLRLFVKSTLSPRHKIVWTLCLVLVGIAIGALLPLAQIRSRMLLLLAIVPILALVDVMLLRSRRGLSFWIRACGFEIVTVFGTAALTRIALT